MAIKGTLAFTLAEWAKRLDPDGKVDKIVELLSQTNEILEDMRFIEGNLPTGNRTTIRTGLPSVTWRKLNYGVQPDKSKTAQVDDTCGMCEAYAQVDKALADLNGNTNDFRLSEDRAFIEAMNQEMATKLFYGDTVAKPEEFLGLAPRYPFLDAPNVIDAGGAGVDLTSLYIVVWGENTTHGFFPKGSKAGLHQENKGQVTLEDENGGMYEGYRTHYKWDIGLVVRDWRYIVRVCNIESSGELNNLIEKPKIMIRALNQLPNMKLGTPVIYCNKEVITQFDEAAFDKGNVQYTSKEVFGHPVTHFRNVPIKRCDALLNTENALVAE